MPSPTPDELIQKLVDSFRSLLDEALVVAIASDCNLQEKAEFDNAHKILEELAQNAASEEASGFNPSGISNDVPGGWSDDVSSATGTSPQASRARDTDTTNSDMASVTTESTYSMPRLTSFNDDSEEDKVLQLRHMFPDLKPYDIEHTLKKANGAFQVALDDLLNIQFLKSTGQEQKGIDAFFQPEEDTGPKKSKGKGRRKGKQPSTSNFDPASNGIVSPDADKELKRQDEIAYLADRLTLPFEQVSEIYYRKKCSSGATAVQLLDDYINLGIETQDEAEKKQAKELAQKYRNVPEKYLPVVVHLTASISQWPDDIAALLSKHFAKNPWKETMVVDYTLKPLPQDVLEGFEPVPSRKASPRGFSQVADTAALAQATDKANHHFQARREAAASAAKLNRRGGSNPLFKQAAGYYSEVAREHSRFAHQAASSAADLLVDRQSTANSIDLHGVTVQDGVRIALERVQSWWDSLGESRASRARQNNFTVITGLGRHSAGGVSPLRKAVVAALLQEGWDLRIETGRYVVTGRRR